VSLSLVGPDDAGAGGSGAGGAEHGDRAVAPSGNGPSSAGRAADVVDGETVSFEDTWEEEARDEFGDLGPAEMPSGGGGGAGRGAERGPRRNPRRRR